MLALQNRLTGSNPGQLGWIRGSYGVVQGDEDEDVEVDDWILGVSGVILVLHLGLSITLALDHTVVSLPMENRINNNGGPRLPPYWAPAACAAIWHAPLLVSRPRAETGV